MVFTLHRYIFREVFKVFVLATVALTLMMSLGSILRPVQEYGAGPRQVVHLMGYFLPITLTFVLPMAALFAAALVYGRLAGDNELDACRASGVSLLTLVYPGLLLAIMVAIANLLLSFYVMPAFVLRAEKSLKDDARQILFRNIQRAGYYQLPPDGRYRIYADYADVRNNILGGVVAAEIKNGAIRKIITAESAKVTFNPHEHFNEVRINAYNTHQVGPAEETSFAAEWLSLTTEFGSLLGDNIKFKKIDQMKRIRLEPMLFYPVARLARQTCARLTAELLAQDINEKTADGNNALYRLHSGQKMVEFKAGACVVRDDRQIMLSDGVTVHEYDLQTSQRLRTFDCQRAMLDIEGDEFAPTLTLDVRNAKWRTERGTENLVARYIVRGLAMPAEVTARFTAADILDDVAPDGASAKLRGGASSELAALQTGLQSKIRNTFAQIDAELHSRLVFGLGCVTLILVGIALGIILKGGHLLTAFAASVIPAMLLIVCIMMGKNVAKNPGSQMLSGVALMWGGLALLCILALWLYHKLLRN